MDDVTSPLNAADLVRIGQAVGDDGDPESAISWLDQSLRMAKGDGNIDDVRKASLGLAEFYEKVFFV